MKRKMTIILLVITLPLIAQIKQEKSQKSKAEIEFEILKDRYKELDVKRNELYETLKTERKNHQDFVENIYIILSGVIGLLALIVSAILSYLGFSNRKGLKEYKKELQKNAFDEVTRLKNESLKNVNNKIASINSDINKKLLDIKRNIQSESDKRTKNISNEMINKISKILDESPAIVEDLINGKMSINHAKNSNEVDIIGDNRTVANDIYSQLKAYGFKVNDNIHIYSNKEELYSIIEKNKSQIRFFVGLNGSGKELIDNLNQKSEILNKSYNFYLGEGFFPSGDWIANFARTKSTIYQNLLDLLRYIEYRKNITQQVLN